MELLLESPIAPAEVAAPVEPCTAQLSLGFTRFDQATRLTGRSHRGPLRVQKALYPEHPSICHAIIVHPPGGVVGGDQLQIAVRLDAAACVLIATPGAAKWYRANDQISRQTVRLQVASAAALEWLPQETILYNGAQVELDSVVDLDDAACFISCDILCFGRAASGEVFDHGWIRQRQLIRRNGQPIWLEQGCIDGTGPMMNSPLGLGGNSVCATLLAAGANLSTDELAVLRAALGSDSGVTQMKAILVVRHLGQCSQRARSVMLTAWQFLRPLMLGHAGVVPRIWNT